MGGGVGVSVHGRYRVGTENIRFAMPEVGIGFFPDVGGTHFLPRLPDRIGSYCALTGARLKQAEAASAGILTHTIGADGLERLFADLTETDDAAGLLDRECGTAADAGPFPNGSTIGTCFAGDTVEAVLAALDAAAGEGDIFAGATAETIRAKSPTSLKIALQQMRVGAGASFRDCMKTEYRIVARVLQGVDFYEGVRATIIDKDNVPKWNPSDLAAVSEAAVAAYFAPLETGDLVFEQ